LNTVYRLIVLNLIFYYLNVSEQLYGIKTLKKKEYLVVCIYARLSQNLIYHIFIVGVVGAHLSRSTFVSRSVTDVFVNIHICNKLEMRQMCSTHNRKDTRSTFVSHFFIKFLTGNNYARLLTGYQPLCCVFCIYNTVLRSLPVSQKLPASAQESYIKLKNIPVLHVTMKISTSAASRT
jgi:hypothetical protein